MTTLKWLRRWWAKWTHRHEWLVILRTTAKGDGHTTLGRYVQFDDAPLILERCHCGTERARFWCEGKWNPVDMDFLNYRINELGIDIPARTHGVKP